MQNGCPKSKLVVGLATYGRGFRLSNAANHGLGVAVSGGGSVGPYTYEAGYLAYYEVRLFLRDGVQSMSSHLFTVH